MDNKLHKPILKWVGGKTQIIQTIINHFPKEIANYHEIFLGGGSVLFALLSKQEQGEIEIMGKIYAYDINTELINFYKNIQTNKDKLFKKIESYKNEYNVINGQEVNRKPKTIEEAKTSKESYYYWLRKKFNDKDNNDSIDKSALFLFLNKTCFRGMYREGPNGFNVPYGHYKKTPTFVTKNQLNIISNLIRDVIFINSGFENSLSNVLSGDFVYMDPPYAPETKKSFVGYNKKGFPLDKHIQLFDEIKKLKKNKIKFLMSNSKVSLVIDNFTDCFCEDIIARRAINSKNPGSKTIEIIIYN
jgi:DNA adenine methylase